jgi:hypothetical protein
MSLRDDLADQQRIKELERQVAELTAQLDRHRSPKINLPRKAAKRQPGESFIRLCIPDTHGTAIEPEAWAAVMEDAERLGPSEIILLGDHLDCGGFLAEHQTLGYVAETDYSFADDVSMANQFLDQVQSLGAERITYLEGNHERRIEKWIVTQTRRHQKDSEHLHKLFSVDSNLHLTKRGIEWIRQGEFHDDLPVPGTIRRGACHFTHGATHSKHSASKHVEIFGGNVVFAHTHRADCFVTRNVTQGVIGAWNPGCLCRLQPLWRNQTITGWSHGYLLQICHANGKFLSVIVPVINGVSMLERLLMANNQ